MELHKNDFNKTVFKASYTKMNQLPKAMGKRPEWAMAGRSNVGKSTVINALCGQKKLAKTSGTPGKTRELVFFSVADKMMLVDLPGYGYARVSQSVQEQWGKELTRYILERENLDGIMIIMDIRHPLTELDKQMLDLISQRKDLKVIVTLNKSDKLSKNAVRATWKKVSDYIKAQYNDLNVDCTVVSGYKKQGLDELRTLLISRNRKTVQDA